MGPSGLARKHPAYKMLLKCATGCCPVDTGCPWLIGKITATVEQGPYGSVLLDDAIDHFRIEVAAKVANGQAKIVWIKI